MVDLRHGFQGSEMDNEVKGKGNSYTTEFRQLDPRLGRWLSLDPLAKQFPDQSPYCTFDNNPIYYNDPRGLAAESTGEGTPKKFNSTFTEQNSSVQSASPPRRINLGLFSIFIKKAEKSEASGLSSRVKIHISLNFVISREETKVIKWQKDWFEIDQVTHGQFQPMPQTTTYFPEPVGNAINNDGMSIYDIEKDTDYSIDKVKLKSKRNDNGGDTFYQFALSGDVSQHNNGNRRKRYDLEVTTITENSTVTGAILNQTVGRGGGL